MRPDNGIAYGKNYQGNSSREASVMPKYPRQGNRVRTDRIPGTDTQQRVLSEATGSQSALGKPDGEDT